MAPGKSVKDLKKELFDLKQQEEKRKIQVKIDVLKRKTSPNKHKAVRKFGRRVASGLDRAASEFFP